MWTTISSRTDALRFSWCSLSLFTSDRKSTRLNSSHLVISYAVFCLKKIDRTLDENLRNVLQRDSGLRQPRSRCMAQIVKFEILQPRLFFFNDTATTEIYTLSLHDALPISTARCLGADGNWNSNKSRTIIESDRKSTRLNSSHLVISYAVFCLKKHTFENSRLLTAHRDATDRLHARGHVGA